LPVGIAGGSCSGKTSLAAALARRWDATVVSLDDYYLDLSHVDPGLRGERNFDHPNALDWTLLLSHLQHLASGSVLQAPLYDFTTHRRTGSRAIECRGGPLIVEGVFALYRTELRESLNLSIFLDVPPAVRLERRLDRDSRERGRSAASIREQHASSVEPMYRRFVLPTREHVDLVLDGRPPTAETTQFVVAAAGAY
jgi:uridine kinase